MTEKVCAGCHHQLLRPLGISNRKWAYLKLCDSCEKLELKRRIEGYTEMKLADSFYDE